MTLNVNIYNLDEQNAQYVKGLNPGVRQIAEFDRPGASHALFSIAISAAMFVVSQDSTRLQHMRDLIYIVTGDF